MADGCTTRNRMYKATSTSGDVFAVKRIHSHLILNNNAGLDFISKIKSLSFINHPNVVPIIGYSQAPGERIIISEFVDGRSLDYFLDGYEILDWRTRVRIAAGIARGLESLHEGGIVHGRIKPSNILISSNFAVKVCDYGLWFLGRDGLMGYLDGEGGGEGSKGSDVYGLGVVLLEILSGRRSEGGLIADWALPLIKTGRIQEFLDRSIDPGKDLGVSVRMAKVASACVGNGRRSRPAIGQVAAILSSLEMI
ncbi:proline-rich receptor-like protein kinase PERK8 [Asparagus officinalis]|uniref:proline-rich receptor-like protein kinase PERK8 n=1 Tax=Asparagus officinalis TaxID=4686 RepID=UPI00098E0287|nr:proline-rich receptor-like protein kinase PERK8 [Asparagus officinalis]